MRQEKEEEVATKTGNTDAVVVVVGVIVVPLLDVGVWHKTQ